jgi:hypothetical protein
MTIRCECDHCGASLKVKDKLAGTEGKCPKCQEKLLIPEVSSDDSEELLLGNDESQPSKPDAAKKTVEESEEDAIFGDDFFSLQEPEPRPRQAPLVIAADDDADDELAPQKTKKPKASETEVSAEISSGSGDNAATIASSLLSKTGKRNRPEDFKDPTEPEKISYDYSELNYLLLQRILPGVGAAVVVFSLAYWMFSGTMGGGVELPDLARLTGRVTNDGEGIEAHLLFLPSAGNSGDGGTSGSSSDAFSGADGSYEVFYDEDIKGLVIGTHEVLISVGSTRIERVVTVEPGSQIIDFELAE